MATSNENGTFITPQVAGTQYVGNEKNQTYTLNPVALGNLGEGDTITISDGGGENRIELAGGLEIASSQVANTEVNLTLSNGAVVEVRGADTFDFGVGQNSLGGVTGEDVNFDTFTQDTLGVTRPAEGVEEGGEAVIEGSTGGGDNGGGDNGGGDNGGGDTGSLADALSTLSNAQQAEVDFREDAPALDSTNVSGTVDVEAGEATAKNIEDYYADVASALGTSAGVSGFAGKTDAVQDSYITAYETSLSSDVDSAKADLPANATSLLETVESRQQAVVDKLIADDTKKDDLSAEKAAFDSANSTSSVSFVEYDAPSTVTPSANEILVISESDYDANADYSPGHVMVDGVIYEGKNQAELKDLTEAGRSSQLSDAYAAQQASASAVTTAKESLQSAIADVVLAENDAYEVDGDVTNMVTYTAGDKDNAKAKVDLTQSVDVFKTKADKTEETKKAEVQKLTVGTPDGSNGDSNSLDVEYGNDDSSGTATVSVTLGSVDTTDTSAVAGEVANQLNADSTFSGLASASASGADVTITYDGSLEGTDIGKSVSATAQGTSNALAATGSETTAGSTDQGTTTSVDAADFGALLTALSDQEDFAELVAQFNEARDLNNTLEGLEQEITDAKAAIENDTDAAEDPGLGVQLLDGGDNFGTGDDVYLFNAKESAGQSLSDFGADGEDQIFFGEGFTLTEVTADEGITGDNGDANAQEIFWEQNGSDLDLYVETETFGGSASGTEDVAQVTLTGVDAAEVELNEDGFLTAGTAADIA